jgi:hypothetical protein
MTTLAVWLPPAGQAGSAIAIGAATINAAHAAIGGAPIIARPVDTLPTIPPSPTSARITTEIGVGVEALRHRGLNGAREGR